GGDGVGVGLNDHSSSFVETLRWPAPPGALASLVAPRRSFVAPSSLLGAPQSSQRAAPATSLTSSGACAPLPSVLLDPGGARLRPTSLVSSPLVTRHRTRAARSSRLWPTSLDRRSGLRQRSARRRDRHGPGPAGWPRG